MKTRSIRSALPTVVLFAAAALFAVSGCTSAALEKARKLEAAGDYAAAAQQYETVARDSGGGAVSAEALYRAGTIRKQHLNDYAGAVGYFSRILDSFPEARPWAERAKAAVYDLPDYFPVSPGSFWVYGDSRTKGHIERREYVVQEETDRGFAVAVRTMRRGRVVSRGTRSWYKVGLEPYARLAGRAERSTVLLAYPFAAGTVWEGFDDDGRPVRYTVEDTGAEVSTVAGSFTDCVKVREERLSGKAEPRFHYYAPGVGQVLTSRLVSGAFERRVSELMSYKILP